MARIVLELRLTVNTQKGADVSVLREITPGCSRVLEKTSYGPVKSNTSTLSNIRIPVFSFSMWIYMNTIRKAVVELGFRHFSLKENA